MIVADTAPSRSIPDHPRLALIPLEALRLYSPAMSKVCHVCRKGPAFGNNRSHSMVATRRRFEPNLQRVRIDDNGTPRRVYVCTRCLKAGKIAKAR
jgi:large subunit ribosomal protein L28